LLPKDLELTLCDERHRLRPKPAVKQPIEQDDLKAALLKKFENVNIYSPFPTAVDPNGTHPIGFARFADISALNSLGFSIVDSFAEPPSPYRVA
jgi:hypothetical protein